MIKRRWQYVINIQGYNVWARSTKDGIVYQVKSTFEYPPKATEYAGHYSLPALLKVKNIHI